MRVRETVDDYVYTHIHIRTPMDDTCTHTTYAYAQIGEVLPTPMRAPHTDKNKACYVHTNID